MSFVSAQCPSCLKSIQVPTDVDRSKCMYCGADVSSPPLVTTAPGVSVTNLLGMARTASLSGNAAEAESYFNRVLELDPRNSEAWLGKGKSAAWQSSLGNMRTQEMAVAFGHAIGSSDAGDQPEMIEACVHEMNHVVATLYGMANKQMHEFISLESTWDSYISQVYQLLSSLEFALEWNPNSTTTLENIVHLCKDNIEGVTFRDQFDNNASKGWALSPDYERMIQQKLDAASNKLKSLNPEYIAPTIEKKKPDACFVVTATMGDESHPTVSLLREFRARILSGSIAGEAFIRWYYQNGPKLARVVRVSKLRRIISYLLVVLPAAFAASLVLRARRK